VLGKATALAKVAPFWFPTQHLAPEEVAVIRVVEQVIGAFYLVRRELFEALGGFDERYFMYFEDVDFAVRARRAGALSYFLKDAKVLQFENVSSDQVHARRLAHSLHSRLVFAREHWAPWASAALVAITFGVELPARLVEAARGRGRVGVRDVLSAYALLLRALGSSKEDSRGGAMGDSLPGRLQQH
jgi:N-acetylglucosaminyl-diphospho-decaprenol L-rhamnosyltransferase